LSKKLVESTLALIREQLAWAKRPVVASSFGKDSQVMLWLVRQVDHDIPVLYFQGFPHATKHDFAKDITLSWNLDIGIPTPMQRDVIVKDNHAEIIELYQIAPNRLMYFPIEAEPSYEPTEDCLCAVEKLGWPVTSESLHYDAIFIGHRNDDVDPTFGAVPLKNYVAESPNGDFRYVYPLRDWTEHDIWKVSGWQDIPQNVARYRDGDMSQNNDYYPMCSNCLRNDEAEVFCPRAGINRRAS
jgi:3'-phosphoadenosine 5'-phosphosulfate sulfotransferase (PAPS reductase)/FAD synthetase